MPTKTKTFDCVEMKNRIQAKQLAEYEAHKKEYASYLDFINAKVKNSELMNFVQRKFQTRENKL
jgi:hypothetical protein